MKKLKTEIKAILVEMKDWQKEMDAQLKKLEPWRGKNDRDVLIIK